MTVEGVMELIKMSLEQVDEQLIEPHESVNFIEHHIKLLREVERLERLKLETVAYYLNDNRDGKNVQLDFEVDMIAIEHDLWLAQGGKEN